VTSLRLIGYGGIGTVAVALVLSGCSSLPQPSRAPAPTVTVTATPQPSTTPTGEAAPGGVKVGDDLTPLEAWDICFAHTTTQVNSDLTEWARFDSAAVTQQGPGSFHVAIAGVRNDSGAAGTVECVVEGRVGGVVLADWSHRIG
jgi:hypothetical protein